MLMYCREDGTAFTGDALRMFDLDLVKRLLYPTDMVWVLGCDEYVDAAFVRRWDDDLRRLTVPVTFHVKRLFWRGEELDWEDGSVIGQVSYCGAPSTNIPAAEADIDILNPFASLVGKTLGVIENNLPIYEALKDTRAYLDILDCPTSIALGITSYRNGKTFSVNGSKLSLELELPVSFASGTVFSSPEEFTIECSGKKLVLTAKEHPSAYTGYGRYPLYAQVVHAETGELSSPAEAGFLEIYLIGAVGPFIHGTDPYQVGGMLVPAGNRSPLAEILAPTARIREDVALTSRADYYRAQSTSTYNLYYQSVEIDDHGVDRYACDGETSYLNSYLIRKGLRELGTDAMEFRFGSIWRGHGCGILDAALECDHMLEAWFHESALAGKLRHFPWAADQDASGLSYCAVANLFGGNGVHTNDLYLDIKK